MNGFKKKEHVIMNILQQAFLPMIIYYMINNAFVLGSLSVLQLIKEGRWEAVWTESFAFYAETGIKMAGMVLGGLSVISYYRREKLQLERKSLARKEGAILIVEGAILSIGLNYVFFITGFMQNSERYQQVAEVQFALPLWLACIFYGVLSPIVEEIVFRGIVCNALIRNGSQRVGIIGSALLFGAFHGNMVQMVYASLMGVILAWIYCKYRNLSAPVLFHGAANVAIYLVTYL